MKDFHLPRHSRSVFSRIGVPRAPDKLVPKWTAQTLSLFWTFFFASWKPAPLQESPTQPEAQLQKSTRNCLYELSPAFPFTQAEAGSKRLCKLFARTVFI